MYLHRRALQRKTFRSFAEVRRLFNLTDRMTSIGPWRLPLHHLRHWNARSWIGLPEAGNVLVSEASKGSCSNLRDSGGAIPLAADQYIEVMVSRNPTTNYMEVHSWVGLVAPPFPAAPVEFPPLTRCTQ